MSLSTYDTIFYLRDLIGEKNLILEKNTLKVTEALERLEKFVLKCKKCPLSKTRTNVVFGHGNPLTGFLMVGEAPGQEEDKRSLPFVGKAGKKLNDIMRRAGIRREGVYVTNTIKCRPPMNRDPEENELKMCFPYLEKQIEILKPKVIVALGRYASYILTGKKISVKRERGVIYEYGKSKVIITIHPSRVLKNPEEEENLFNDLVLAKKIYISGHP
ncbi:MAG: uracil-DNA glycosylase [Candidatus Hydrothermales bacterium]